MLLFSIIFSAISVSLDYNELNSFNSDLSDYQNKLINEEQLEEKIEVFDKQEEDSDKYTLLIKNVRQFQKGQKIDFQKVVDINSDGKYYAYYFGARTVLLEYTLPKSKCIKEIKFKMPQNISEGNQCHWVNTFDNILDISNQKFNFKDEWKTDDCLETQHFSITSNSIKKLGQNEIICVGDLEITD